MCFKLEKIESNRLIEFSHSNGQKTKIIVLKQNSINIFHCFLWTKVLIQVLYYSKMYIVHIWGYTSPGDTSRSTLPWKMILYKKKQKVFSWQIFTIFTTLQRERIKNNFVGLSIKYFWKFKFFLVHGQRRAQKASF